MPNGILKPRPHPNFSVDNFYRAPVNSSSETAACLRMLCGVPGAIERCIGTVVHLPPFAMRTWEPTCRVMLKPSRRRALTTCAPEMSRGNFTPARESGR
jgi:hypothetical protein